MNPEDVFHSAHYLKITEARREHFESLGLPVAGLDVLEVGAGIGDFSKMLLTLGCRSLVATDARMQNVCILQDELFSLNVEQLWIGQDIQVEDFDLDSPNRILDDFDMVFCYGLLYHLRDPYTALHYLTERVRKRFGYVIVETCCTHTAEEEIQPKEEDKDDPTASIYGLGCRPSTSWLWGAFSEMFPYVYTPRTQPDHEEFPVNWNESPIAGASRMIVIGSFKKLDLPTLQPCFNPDSERYVASKA